MSEKALHIIYPGFAGNKGWILTIEPKMPVDKNDCPVPELADIRFEKFTPEVLSRLIDSEGEAFIVNHISRG